MADVKRRTPIKKRNAKRGGHRFPKNVNESYRRYIRGLPCSAAPRQHRGSACNGGVICAHLKTRGAGGKDIGNTVPLCWWHHVEQEGRTKAFQEEYGLDLAAIAAKLALAYDPEEPPVW